MSHRVILTFPSSYHKIAWFRDKTLQSKIQLFVAGLLFATERPIFTGSVKGTLLSSKGWELGRDVNTAIAILLISCCSSRRLLKSTWESWQLLRMSSGGTTRQLSREFEILSPPYYTEMGRDIVPGWARWKKGKNQTSGK